MGAVSLGAFAELHGDVCAGGAFYIRASALMEGDVDVVAAVSIASKAVLNGDILTQAALTIGAGGNMTGTSSVGMAVTLGASAHVTGNIAAQMAVGLGAGAVVTGNVYAGGAVVLGAGANIEGVELAAVELPASGVFEIINEVKSMYDGLRELTGGKDLNTAIANDDLVPGVYDHGSAWPLAAGRTITFVGSDTDIWIIRINGATAIAGDFEL
jgi:cytoskeletal protein CcmA (bactofilin family)